MKPVRVDHRSQYSKWVTAVIQFHHLAVRIIPSRSEVMIGDVNAR
jgi:hypothetical protein